MPTPAHSPELNTIAVKAWLSAKCRCGKQKREKESFCWACWNALEDCRQRRKLHGTYGSEFTSAYLACCEYLQRKAEAKP